VPLNDLVYEKSARNKDHILVFLIENLNFQRCLLLLLHIKGLNNYN
jgi:hypothetical protein